MKDGMTPPRLEGGVAYAEEGRGLWHGSLFAEVREVGRGMAEDLGEVERGKDDGGVIIAGVLEGVEIVATLEAGGEVRAGLPNVKVISSSSLKSKSNAGRIGGVDTGLTGEAI